MEVRWASIVVFFREEDRKILIQDRRNITKDTIEWSFFGWQQEVDESFLDCALREIQEELGIHLAESEIIEIGHTIMSLKDIATTEIHIFFCRWKEKYEGFTVFEWAGYQWVTFDEFKELSIYPINHVQIAIVERYLSL